jgi:hypothetical protein
MENREKERLSISANNKNWKKWGPYLSDRQWATVREDYSENGDTWNYVSHDAARSYAYRWGEDGIAGFCDAQQILCLAPTFWNGQDPIIKERLFGLTNNQGNHGEDVKELYFHLDSSPTHSYCKILYKYPQTYFPYDELVNENQRSKKEDEYEIIETKAFQNNQYFDIVIEYAKADVNDILLKITAFNRYHEKADLHVIPHLWFRNFWKHNPRYSRPLMKLIDNGTILSHSIRNGKYYFYFNSNGTPLFCNNETNAARLFGEENDIDFVKDGINNHIVNGDNSVNKEMIGTKSAVHFKETIPAGGKAVFQVRLSKKPKETPWEEFNFIFDSRIQETNIFYDNLGSDHLDENQKKLLRKSFAGLLWTKQFYYLDVHKWLNGESGAKGPVRQHKKNERWEHLTNRDIISMPDKWEYPWYAVWDLAFHTTSFVEIDPDFAKEQLLLVLREFYMHPNGQIPAYEWNFSDVNPPVHSWAVWDVYEKDKKANGKGDYDFLERCFQKLLINFTWWVNQKDSNEISLFEGGFLGLDNIGVFDRNNMPKGIKKMQQADATSWMAMFSLDMLRISIELATRNPAYEESAAKFLRHFLNIAWAMHHIGKKDISLWDEEDAFYYDVVQMETGVNSKLRVRSLVGIIPLFAIEIIQKELIDNLKEFKSRAERIIRTRPDLANLISRIEEENQDDLYLFSIMRGFRLEHLLKRMLDENEFLSEFGIRSLSKIHEQKPFVFDHHGKHSIKYEPGESLTNMFGGNSNWRGPIWLPINYLIIQSLRKYYAYYGPKYTYEFPTGSGEKLNLKEIANEISLRVLKLFQRDESGKYTYHTDTISSMFSKDEYFKDHHLFYEFFHGDTGRGLGASHQTGWTALVSNILLELED